MPERPALPCAESRHTVFVRQGDRILPARVVKDRRWWPVFAIFTPYQGVKVRAVRRRRVVDEATAQDYFDFKADPFAYFTTGSGFTALDVPAFADGSPMLLAVATKGQFNARRIVIALAPDEARRLHHNGRLNGWTPS